MHVHACVWQVPLLCSLNQLPKLDPALYATWLNALRRAAAPPGPPSRLWLLRFPAAAIARLRAEAAAHLSAAPAAALLDLPTVAYEVTPATYMHGARLLYTCTCTGRARERADGQTHGWVGG